MRALVTGGNGFLGRYIVEKLCARNQFVRVLSRSGGKELHEAGLEVDLVTGDLGNSDLLNQCCQGIDTVFHTAAYVSMWGKREDFFRVNVEGTKNLISACQQQKVKSLVYTSSPSVVFSGRDLIEAEENLPYPQHFSAYYPLTKSIAESLVIAANGVSGLATCSLRPHLLWGPRDNHLIPQIVKRAREGKLVVIGNGENIVDFTFVTNAADAHIAAADALASSHGQPPAGQCYFISQDEPIPLWDFISLVLQRFNVDAPKTRVPYRLALAIAKFLEAAHKLLPILGEPRITYFLAQQLGTSHYFSNRKALRDFGYCPEISLARGLELLAESSC